MKLSPSLGLILLLSAMPATAQNLPGADNLSLKAKLGQKLFFDTKLSEPAGQACASCHDPDHAFTDPDHSHPTSKGANPNLFGNRNAPSAMYASYAPEFGYDRTLAIYLGGQFHDGRSANLAEQAKGPFLSPLEMNNADASMVIAKVRNSEYAEMFDQVYGEAAWDDEEQTYRQIAEAIAEFERSPVFNRFTSKYDFYLFGKAQLTASERRGLKLFENQAECYECHPNRPQNGNPPLFTDFSYDNLGLPKNPDNLFYAMPAPYNPEGELYIDLGLGKVVKNPDQDGKFKVQTLRNVELTAPYMHNGYFKTLESTIEFYNSRDTRQACRNPWTNDKDAVRQKCWNRPEVADNINRGELGSLNLSKRQIKDLVAFLKTLTDGYGPSSPWKIPPP